MGILSLCTLTGLSSNFHPFSFKQVLGPEFTFSSTPGLQREGSGARLSQNLASSNPLRGQEHSFSSAVWIEETLGLETAKTREAT